MNPYFERMVLDADPVELVRMMYERALQCIAEARAHIAAGRIAERSQAIICALEVVHELQAALREDAAPQLTRRLRELYLFVQTRLTAANFQQKAEPLDHAEKVLRSLHEAWSQLASQKGSAAVCNPAAVGTAEPVARAAIR